MISLRGNLAEMAAVKNDLLAELVPSSNHEKVFHRDYARGITLVLINPWKDLRGELILTLDKIQTIFGSSFLQLKTHNATYFKYYIKKPLKKMKAEEKILEIITSIKPTIKHFIKNPDLPYIKFLSGFSSKELIQRECKYAHVVQKIKDFEIETHSSVPISVLYQLALNEDLTDKEEFQVKEWIKGLKTDVRYFHRFLRVLISSFPKEADLAIVELALENRQCTVFQKIDPRLEERYKLMKVNDRIQVKGKDYILGNPLSNPKVFPVYFSLQNQPDSMLVVERSEAVNGMKLRSILNHHSGIMMPLTMAEEGAFSIIERCYHPLNEIRWTGALDDQARVLVELLEGLYSLKFTSGPLLPEHFAFNLKGEMRCLSLMKPQVKSFEEIEIFAWKCAKNSIVYSHLAKASKMCEQPEAKAYHELMHLALKGNEKNMSVSLGGKIKNLQILTYRELFYSEVLSLKAKLEREMGGKKIINSIAACHLKYCPGHFLVPNFYELCKSQINIDNRIV